MEQIKLQKIEQAILENLVIIEQCNVWVDCKDTYEKFLKLVRFSDGADGFDYFNDNELDIIRILKKFVKYGFISLELVYGEPNYCDGETDLELDMGGYEELYGYDYSEVWEDRSFETNKLYVQGIQVLKAGEDYVSQCLTEDKRNKILKGLISEDLFLKVTKAVASGATAGFMNGGTVGALRGGVAGAVSEIASSVVEKKIKGKDK